MQALIFCGSVSGAFTSFFLTPIELIKCKIQVPTETQRAQSLRQPTVGRVVASIYRQEGFFAFWRGHVCTFWRETGGNAFWFGINELMKKMYKRRAARAGLDDSQQQKLKLHQHLLSGAAAGVGYNFSFYPFDTVKSCQQTEEIGTSASGKRSLASIAKEIWQHQGIKGFYQGCGLTLARSAVGSAIIFTVYDYLKSTFG
jgi:mitochondrial ornithine carrier protein